MVVGRAARELPRWVVHVVLENVRASDMLLHRRVFVRRLGGTSHGAGTVSYTHLTLPTKRIV